MQPISTPEARTEVAYPDEAERLALAAELETHIVSLNDYCDQVPQPERAQQINELIALVGQYDQATEQLLSYYRHALEHAQRPNPQPVPTLEQAILRQMSPAALLAYREADPVYRLGFVRGQQHTHRQYATLTSLYAQYALIVPPLNYTPTPVITRAKAAVAQWLMTGPRYPLATRQTLLGQTVSPPRPDAQS